MNEDYLWDRSGEPDPEIDRLEAALSSLRYKRPARPLPLPGASRPSFRISSTWLAAAAAVALLIAAGGLWFVLHRSVSNEQGGVAASGTAPKAVGEGKDVPTPPTRSAGGANEQVAVDNKGDESPGAITSPAPRNLNRPRQTLERRQEIAVLRNRERALREEETVRRGELAKEQLIKALQITSDKLSTVQKKIQGNQEHNPIS